MKKIKKYLRKYNLILSCLVMLALQGQLLAAEIYHNEELPPQLPEQQQASKPLKQKKVSPFLMEPVELTDENKIELAGSYVELKDSPALEPLNKPGKDQKYEKIQTHNWAYKVVKELDKKYNLLSGDLAEKFQNDRQVNRYELAQALAQEAQKIKNNNIEPSTMETAAIKSLQYELEQEIMTLAARVEHNEKEIQKLKIRHYFRPEMRFRVGFGDLGNNDTTLTNVRLRLNSKTEFDKYTSAFIRLHAQTRNLINESEVRDEVVDTDLTLAYLETEYLTRWIPDKYGDVSFIGGFMPANRVFTSKHYTVSVDSRGFGDSNLVFSEFNSQLQAFSREGTDGRRASIGGEYVKTFKSFPSKIKLAAVRTTGGSFDIDGQDIKGSGRDSTFFCATGRVDFPVNKQNYRLRLTYFNSRNDNASSLDTWSVGGKLSTKFEGVGVVKAALIGYGGSVPPRLIGGLGGNGLSYQIAFNPTFKGIGNIFGDPDKIPLYIPSYVPGKTEIGLGISNFHNDQSQSVRAYEVYLSRYFTDHIFGRVLLSHVVPYGATGINKRTSVMLETIVRF